MPSLDDILPWDDNQPPEPEPVEPPSGPLGLHPAQQAVFDGLTRFNVIAAGRRFGKTHLACKLACWYARHTHWPNGRDLKNADVWYVAPTMDLALETAVPMVLEELGDEVKQHHKVQNWIMLENGRKIYFKSAGRPDLLRGRAVSAVIIDEISIMKPNLWEMIIRPALVSVAGKAVFIGTPVGKGKLWELYQYAQGSDPEWTGWQFKTLDNPMISSDEVKSAALGMTRGAFKQEFEADFATGGGNIFKASQLKIANHPRGICYMALVLGSDSNFAVDAHALSGSESALVVVRAHPLGWHVLAAWRGYWSVSEAVQKVCKAWDRYAPRFLALSNKDLKTCKNLIQEYRKHADFRSAVRFHEVYDPDDIDRIKWSLQSRLKAKQITIGNGRGKQQLGAQLQDFPLEYTNNELVQALSYIDQLPQPNFGANSRDRFRPLDNIAGY